jgi:hypothetical protein
VKRYLLLHIGRLTRRWWEVWGDTVATRQSERICAHGERGMIKILIRTYLVN